MDFRRWREWRSPWTRRPLPNIYVTGFTGSPDFPVSTNALIRTPGPGGTASGGVSVHNQTHSFRDTGTAQLAYSSYLGGNTEDEGNGIAVDASGDAISSRD